MAAFEVVFLQVAEAAYSALSATERAAVDQLLGILEIDPYVDGVFKTWVEYRHARLSVYDNGEWNITYLIVDNAFIEIWAIYRSMPPGSRQRQPPTTL